MGVRPKFLSASVARPARPTDPCARPAAAVADATERASIGDFFGEADRVAALSTHVHGRRARHVRPHSTAHGDAAAMTRALELLARDARHALRMLRRERVLVVGVVATFALTIGTNATMFG